MTRSKRNTKTKALQNLKALRTLAIEKVGQAREAVEAAREVVIARTDEARAKAGEMVTSLEKVFEQRVSKAINRLGVPSAKEVRDLSRQVSQLKASVEKLRRARA